MKFVLGRTLTILSWDNPVTAYFRKNRKTAPRPWQAIAQRFCSLGDFLSFADYFFDGIIADIMVQSRIKEAKKQVEDAIRRVQYILAQLE